MKTASIQPVSIIKVTSHEMHEQEDLLAIEEPLEIQLVTSTLHGRLRKNISVTMRTPGDDADLAAGFLFTEGIINNNREIERINTKVGDDNVIIITLVENVSPSLLNSERNFYTTSSCGVCGKASIDAIKTISVFSNLHTIFSLKAGLFYGLQDKLLAHQSVFESTGGLHACALFDLNGKLVHIKEDVGRHNALDKLIGMALLAGNLPLLNGILLLSGRASFELIQKATMAGIKVIASIGAPSSLAVELARENDITLVSFLRKERFNIYAGAHRIML